MKGYIGRLWQRFRESPVYAALRDERGTVVATYKGRDWQPGDDIYGDEAVIQGDKAIIKSGSRQQVVDLNKYDISGDNIRFAQDQQKK